MGSPEHLNPPSESATGSTTASLHIAAILASVAREASSFVSPTTSPSLGSYDDPETSKARNLPLTVAPGTTTRVADIWLVVSVPVLSLQITDVHPRVSTDCNLRTMAFFLAIFLVPSARQVVITAGSPSGIAATASATAILK